MIFQKKNVVFWDASKNGGGPSRPAEARLTRGIHDIAKQCFGMCAKEVEARESPPERRPPRYFKIKTSCFGMLSKTAEARGGPPKTRPPQYSIRKTVCFGRLSKTVEARGGPPERGPPRYFIVKTAWLRNIMYST